MERLIAISKHRPVLLFILLQGEFSAITQRQNKAKKCKKVANIGKTAHADSS